MYPTPVPGRLSVIVPTYNANRTLEACLESVRAQTYAELELLVVDNDSTDGTVTIAEALVDVVASWGPERSAQRNRGAEFSSGEYLLFLDSDLLLEPEVAEQAVGRLCEEPEVGGLIIPELAFGQGFWAACRALEKRLYVGNSSVEAARIFRRDVFEAAGGYDEGLIGNEDWDLPDRVRRLGYRIGRIDAFCHHDEGRLSLRETFRKKRYYGRTAGRYLRKAPATGLSHLARTALLARPRRLTRHPHLALGLFVLKAVEGVGFVSGMVPARCGGDRRASLPSSRSRAGR